MKLKLIRRYNGDTYTIGSLWIDGEYFCDTLEDKMRDINKNGKFDNGEVKVMHETAIPYGTYQITLDVVSPKFKDKPVYAFCNGKLPRLLNVPSFEGILIHIGNTASDSSGCILVGKNTTVGRVNNSTETFISLYQRLAQASGPISIEIV